MHRKIIIFIVFLFPTAFVAFGLSGYVPDPVLGILGSLSVLAMVASPFIAFAALKELLVKGYTPSNAAYSFVSMLFFLVVSYLVIVNWTFIINIT